MPDDSLTLTLRLHDPKEKTDPKKSAQWSTRKVSREDLKLPQAEFIAKYLAPMLGELGHLAQSSSVAE